MVISLINNRMGTDSLKNGTVQGVGLMGSVSPMVLESPYGMASGCQEEPFSRLALALHCDESSLYLQKGFAHSCYDFGGKIQNGVLAHS